jgi:hypothetical protein
LPIEQRRRAFVRELAQVARTEVLFPQQLAMSVQCENTHDPIRIADRMFDRTAVHGHEAGKSARSRGSLIFLSIAIAN